ncbi:MAG: hydrogenase maturation nickel metallochaperone HypA [Deltaproteobacteria bacterium]|jgi:hydrogenase nickel incorporation protein HypA/HybF|nr:MAG: hydrogenase maturation nickel metallochaperone HypA [Deltaproteobacteria bacterium]
MHELGIAQQVIEIASERSSGAAISRIVLEVGRLTAVLPDALRFCFDAASEGTPAAGAELQIIEVPGVARCRQCGGRVELERPYGRCACGGDDLEWLSGEELRIKELEVI